jgi:hypothetical protein
MTRSTVIADLITKYDAIVTGQDKSAIELAVFKIAICQLVDAAFSGGGGGTTIATVSDGIDASVDIGTIITRLASLDTGKLTQSDITSAIQAAADIDTIISNLATIATNQAPVVITTYTHSTASVVDTGVTVLAANASRKAVTIINRSATDPVDLFFGTVGTFGAGLPLAFGQVYEINTTNLYRGIITARSGSGITVSLAVAEGV